MAQGVWAQGALIPNENGTVWTLSSMPAYDIVLTAEYYADKVIFCLNKVTFCLYYCVFTKNIVILHVFL